MRCFKWLVDFWGWGFSNRIYMTKYNAGVILLLSEHSCQSVTAVKKPLLSGKATLFSLITTISSLTYLFFLPFFFLLFLYFSAIQRHQYQWTFRLHHYGVLPVRASLRVHPQWIQLLALPDLEVGQRNSPGNGVSTQPQDYP